MWRRRIGISRDDDNLTSNIGSSKIDEEDDLPLHSIDNPFSLWSDTYEFIYDKKELEMLISAMIEKLNMIENRNTHLYDYLIEAYRRIKSTHSNDIYITEFISIWNNIYEFIEDRSELEILLEAMIEKLERFGYKNKNKILYGFIKKFYNRMLFITATRPNTSLGRRAISGPPRTASKSRFIFDN